MGIARELGVPSTLAMGLSSPSVTMPIEEADRTLVLLDEALDLSSCSATAPRSTPQRGVQGNIAPHRGDFRAALDTVIDIARQSLDSGELVNIAWPFLLAAVALTHLGHAEAAAVLSGTGWAIVVEGPEDWMWRMAHDIDAPLTAELGSVELEALHRAGAALAPLDALAYLIGVTEDIPPRSDQPSGSSGIDQPRSLPSRAARPTEAAPKRSRTSSSAWSRADRCRRRTAARAAPRRHR